MVKGGYKIIDCTVTDGSYSFSAYGKTFTIANDDTIKLA